MVVLRTFLCGYRNAHALSQEEVAHRAGVALPTYRRLEAFPIRNETAPRVAAPTLRTVVQVLRAIDVEDEFLTALDESLSRVLKNARRSGCAAMPWAVARPAMRGPLTVRGAELPEQRRPSS
jgi:transcriptional regulator with XRE-family HTH domain